MRVIRFYLTLLIFACIHKFTFSQPPNDDPHWILNFNDNFNFLDHSFLSELNNAGPGHIFDPSMVSINAGQLNLTAVKIGNQLYTGGVTSLGKKQFNYGYFEIDAQYPNVTNRAGFHCTFWLHLGSCHNYAEIDVWEPDGLDGINNFKYHCGLFGTSGSKTTIMHCNQCLPVDPMDTNCICEDNYCKGKTVFNPPILTGLTSWNRYAVEWTPQSCIFYQNNQPIDFALYPDTYIAPFLPAYNGDAQIVPSRIQELYLTFGIDTVSLEATTTFPATLKFDNFRYYKLNLDCSNSLVASNFNFLTHIYRVKGFISLSNSIIPANSKIFLRAVDYVELNGTFEVPLGSEFSVITHYGFCPR